MLKIYLLQMYIFYFEKVFNTKNIEKINKVWNNIKNSEPLLKFAISINNNKINSKIIAYMMLKDKELYDSPIYNTLIKIIYSNNIVAKEKINKTLLMLTFQNENLILNDTQKRFLLNEAYKCPYTEKYYEENMTHLTSIHGQGLFDVRYEIIKNKNFTLEEKKNLFNSFYPDDEMKITIIDELEWEVFKEISKYIPGVKYKISSEIENFVIIKIMQHNNINLLSKINLCIEIRKNLSNETIKKHVNHE